jgi:hypothetical protein
MPRHEPNQQDTRSAKTTETGDIDTLDSGGGGGLGGAGRTRAVVSAALIPNARKAYRMASMWVAALAVIFGSLPPDQQSAILSWLGLAPERIPAVLGVLFIVTRLVNQPKTHEG